MSAASRRVWTCLRAGGPLAAKFSTMSGSTPTRRQASTAAARYANKSDVVPLMKTRWLVSVTDLSFGRAISVPRGGLYPIVTGSQISNNRRAGFPPLPKGHAGNRSGRIRGSAIAFADPDPRRKHLRILQPDEHPPHHLLFLRLFFGRGLGVARHKARAVFGGDHLPPAIACPLAVAGAHGVHVDRQHRPQVALQVGERFLANARVGLRKRQTRLAQQGAQVTFRNRRERAQCGLPLRLADGRNLARGEELPKGVFTGLIRHEDDACSAEIDPTSRRKVRDRT